MCPAHEQPICHSSEVTIGSDPTCYLAAARMVVVIKSPITAYVRWMNWMSNKGSRPRSVLFLCTENSARSIMAECLLNRWGSGRFQAFSAGSHPKGSIHPLTLAVLQENGYDTRGLRSKSWDEFAGSDADPKDVVITVCDNAAGGVCPIWPGHPVTAHWGFEDPAAVQGSNAEKHRRFQKVFQQIESRVKTLVALLLNNQSGPALQKELRSLGSRPVESD